MPSLGVVPRLLLMFLLVVFWLSPIIATSTPQNPAPIKTQAPADSTPSGFVEVTVSGVMPAEQGTAVVLRCEKEHKLLPIWIGEAEAFAIQLRLERRRYERPLTHDLLDTVMQKLGGQLLKVHVDGLKGNTFVGTIFIRQAGRVHAIDARPSDAIALALGSSAPIFVSRSVLDQVGVLEQSPPTKSSPQTQDKLLKDILESGKPEHSL